MSSESIRTAPATAGPGRRTVVAAVGAAGLTCALTACSSNDGTSDAAGSGKAADGGSSVLASTSDIPEGGGKIFGGAGVVVTQPTAGTFKAFSSTCTHQGCAVGSVADGVITCPCHNSQFSAADGSVKRGPATEPLPAKKITVSGDSIKLA
ncbi:Rieske (2Fe-2S) protein [Streptomyces sp. NPDC090306]|uniref:Rieske (2Fe-2S) protein n=1 Tax=Streptomyces sp. NPDC090306 TaxID=3365961 RepID=UPI003822B0A3